MVEKSDFDISVSWYNARLKTLARVATKICRDWTGYILLSKILSNLNGPWLKSSLCNPFPYQSEASQARELCDFPGVQLWMAVESGLCISHALTLTVLRNTQNQKSIWSVCEDKRHISPHMGILLSLAHKQTNWPQVLKKTWVQQPFKLSLATSNTQ